MATQFVQATNKKTGFKSSLQDSEHLINLFVALSKRNARTGEKMSDWSFELLDSRGRLIEKDYNWKKVHVSVKLGDLFK